jgi:hypothetical protein
MENEQFGDIKKIILEFQDSLKSHLPALEAETNALIRSKSQNKNEIERHLDALLSLMDMGVGKDLFVRLLEYYKTVDAEGAMFYWNEFDKDEEEF